MQNSLKNYGFIEPVPFKGDKLALMFQKQLKFAKLLKTKPEGQEYINIAILAIICESMEALQNTEWKPWKASKVFNKVKFKEEIIDIWHFLINLSLAAGFDENTLYKAFLRKNDINIQRQKQVY